MNTETKSNYSGIYFEQETYILAWSKVTDFFYKQEYIRKNDSLDKFNKMITVDVLITDLNAEDLVSKKISELNKRKGNDPVVNYQLIENKQTGEFLLDFLISDSNIYEWNAYRYKAIHTNKGKAVLLFAFTLRTFDGAELNFNEFFAFLKKDRNIVIQSLANYTLPNITLRH